jgi:beta-glucosidase
VYREGIFVGYRGYEKNHTKPLFPFGYGLSYTTFKFSNLTIKSEFSSSDPRVNISFDVTNTGSRSGAQIAQVYVAEDHASVARPAHELKGFERVQLAPKETKQVNISLDRRAFAYYNVAVKKWTIDSGAFTIQVGDSSQDIFLKGAVAVPSDVAKSGF